MEKIKKGMLFVPKEEVWVGTGDAPIPKVTKLSREQLGELYEMTPAPHPVRGIIMNILAGNNFLTEIPLYDFRIACLFRDGTPETNAYLISIGIPEPKTKREVEKEIMDTWAIVNTLTGQLGSCATNRKILDNHIDGNPNLQVIKLTGSFTVTEEV